MALSDEDWDELRAMSGLPPRRRECHFSIDWVEPGRYVVAMPCTDRSVATVFGPASMAECLGFIAEISNA